MNALLRKNYLEQIRIASIHPTLRLMTDLVAGLALMGSISATLVLFTSGHPWLAFYSLVSIALIYVLRSFAVLIVDVVDMLTEHGAKMEVASTGSGTGGKPTPVFAREP